MVTFIVDGMLGSMARKLRIYGFDVLYDAEGLDEDILTIAERDGRAILTFDKDLHKKAILRGLKSFLVSGEGDEDRIVAVFKTFDLKPELSQEKSRCPLCNGDIKEVGKESLESVPESVLTRHDRFYSCVRCGKVYWMGSHWIRLKNLSEKIRGKL
ncbi:MAG: Mut7-C RNAse domain-containing protein [Nitrososphaerales archaeon]|nr:Mut7-C RNAse domain-containing protein [Nitrososphaerales archaeon]